MTVYTPDTDDRRQHRRTDEREAGRATRPMRAVDHTNPYTDETFGDSLAYTRGRVAVVDGGKADAEPADEKTDEEDETIRDVDHTPREDAPSTNEVYERGGEGKSEDDAESDDAEAAEETDPEEVPE